MAGKNMAAGPVVPNCVVGILNAARARATATGRRG